MAKRKTPPARPPARRAAVTTGFALQAAIVFGIAILLRFTYLSSIHDAYFFQHPQTEPLHYHEWATAILAGARAPTPPFEQAPGYPYFVAGIYALCGLSFTAVALVQSILDACTCVLIGRVTGAWFGTRSGLLAGLLAAAYGPLIYFSAELLPTTLFVFLVVAAIAASLPGPLAQRPPGRARRAAAEAVASATGRFGLAACLWGAALLVRSEAVLAFPFVLLDTWQRGQRRSVLRSGLILALFVAAPLALNLAVTRRFVPFTTSGGVNLWLGNNPHADGVNPFVTGPLRVVDELVRGRAADAADADRLFRSRALEFWHGQPGAAAWLLWKKFLWTLTDCELPNTSDIAWQTRHSWLFRLPWLPLRWGVVLPLALTGAVLAGRQLFSCLLLAAPLAVGLGTSVLFFTNARFRLIMVPSLLMLAAVALDRVPRLGFERPRRIVAATVAALIGLFAAWGNPYGVQSYRVPQILVNTGILEREAGHFDAAVQLLRDGVHDDSRDSIGWIHLALALEQDGQPGDALQAYFSALTLADSPDVRQMSARFFVRHGLDLALLEAFVAAPNPSVQTDVSAKALRQLRGAPSPLHD